MSLIDKLTVRHCWHQIIDICDLKRGKSITRKNIENGSIPVIAGGRKPAYFHNKSNREGTTIVIAGSGAYAGFVSYWTEPIFVSDAFSIKPKKNNVLAKYVYYYLKSRQNLLYTLKQEGGGVPHFYIKTIAPLSIPVPPLEIQSEIVQILDKFTELEAELKAELEARRRQYEYYRDALLSFNGSTPPLSKWSNVQWETLGEIRSFVNRYHDLLSSHCPEDVEFKTIQELFVTRNGYTPSKSNPLYWSNGTVPWFRMEDIRKNGRILGTSIQKVTEESVKGGNLFAANSIIIATTATIGEHALITVPHLSNQRFTSLVLKQEYDDRLNIRFLFYYCFLLGEWCRRNTTTSSFASVDMQKFRLFRFPIPPMGVQQEIVSVLDKFDTLVNDLSAGLPAEILARRQQYEHYRERLLTFQKAA